MTVTDIVQLLTAVSALLAAVAAVVAAMRGGKAVESVKESKGLIVETNHLVNSQHKEMKSYQQDLIQAVQSGTGVVPLDPSIQKEGV